MTILTAIALMAEKITEMIKEAFPGVKGRAALLRGVSLAAGVGLCLAFDADIFRECGVNAAFPVIGRILSGIICGAGSNLLHEVRDALAGKTEFVFQSGPDGINNVLEGRVSPDSADEGVM